MNTFFFLASFIRTNFYISSSANLLVPKAAIEIPETAAPTSLPQTDHVVPVKKGRPLVPSDTLMTAWYAIPLTDGLFHC